MHIKVGLRSSKLSIAQAQSVLNLIKETDSSITFEIIEIKTKGDKLQNTSLSKIGDKGIFVSEIENQLLNHDIDMAIHSMKDMPSFIPEELTLTNTPSREDVRDVLILPKGIKELKEKPIIGTGSFRRALQIKKLIPDCTCKDIRGNIDTRLKKLDQGQYDAIILAAAGLNRLGLSERIYRYFEIDEMIPACCQGALAIECRKEDVDLQALLFNISNHTDSICTKAEREYLSSINGDCHMPIGAYCQKNEKEYTFYALYGKDTSDYKEIILTGKNPNKLARLAAKEMLEEK